MSSIADIEHAIKELSQEELAQFRQWFAEFDAQRWDQKFEVDASSGRLDKLGGEALADSREGHCTDL